jgi:two-component system sensor histidine kinase KdpD
MSTKSVAFLLDSMNGHQSPYAFRESVGTRSHSSFTASRSVLRRLRASPVGRTAMGLLAILSITESFRLVPSFNATTIGFAYLLAILAASTCLDLRTSLYMCLGAALAYDYYVLPPVGSLNIDDPQDWVALFSFLATALVGTKLAATARRRAEEATSRRLEVERLYSLSQKLLSTVDPLDSIPRHIAESFGFQGAALYHSDRQKAFSSGMDLDHLEISNLQEVAARGYLQVESGRNVCFAPVRLGNSCSGSIAISGPAPSRETIEAVASLVAVALDRVRSIERVAKVEAARENERLKSVFLDAITHDFRTPLTSIKVSATGLLDNLDFDREQRKELLTIIDEECDRINQLVGEASEMARLESGEVKLDLALHSIGELVTDALRDCKEVTRNRQIRLDVKHQDLQLLVDLPLAKKVFIHLVSNAHLYSSPGQPIRIATEERDGFHVISVEDKGPGIEATEVGHIFEKFYRGKHQRYRIQGTGMGLPIAKAIVETHGGTIGVVSRADCGSVFTFTLPVQW